MSCLVNNVAVLLVSETKLDDSFLKTIQIGPRLKWRWILLFVKDDMSSRLLTDLRLPDNVECFFIEINIRNKKWLLRCSHNPHKNDISNHISHLSKGLDNYKSI